VTGVLDAFTVTLKLSLYAGLIVSSPVWLWQLWRFVTPGLHAHERRYAVTFVGTSLALFSTGATIAYFTLQTGLRFLPFTVISFFTAVLSGNLSERIPARILLGVGVAMVAAGLFLMRGLTPSSGWTALLPGFIVSGAGLGLVNPALASTSIGVVPPQRSGMAAGINNTFRQVGTATGIAVLGAIFESMIRSDLAPNLVATPAAAHKAQIAHAVAAGGTQKVLASVPPTARAHASAAIHVAFTSAMNDILLVAGIIALTGAVLAFALVRSRDFAAYTVGEPAAAAAGG